MHHALQIQEILSNIFAHCRLHGGQRPVSDLLSLARTCRTFKEPALDVLWEELDNPSPLAQCLPDATHQISCMNEYSFVRQLMPSEWDILRSYARRIRIIKEFSLGLDWDSVRTFFNPPATEPLFPNLRWLRCGYYATDVMHLLCLPLPSLISVDFAFQFQENLHRFQDSLESFLQLAPNIRSLSISVQQPGADFVSGYISRWQSLQDVHCPEISLDVDALLQLSRMPALIRLTFTLSATLPDQIAPPDSPLAFSNLHYLKLHSESLVSVSSFLSRTRLPVITDLSIVIESPPLKRDVSSFLATVRTSSIGRTIQGLQLAQVRSSADGRKLPLGFSDLRPCMTFNDLRRMTLDVECDVVLSDCDVLALTSAWPRLESFAISH